jgi:GTP pyrophosphokinase
MATDLLPGLDAGTLPAADGSDRDTDIVTSHWVDGLGVDYTPEQLDLIGEAARLAVSAHTGQTRASGEPYYEHPLAVAGIVNELQLDHEAVCAALLHDVVEDTTVTLDQLEEQFGNVIAHLVDGVTKMDVIGEYEGGEKKAKDFARVENLRKMLLAMVEDVRVVLVKLADRLHNMRTLKALPQEKQVRIARETLDIFAPLANRLGVWQLKWELEDLSLRYLEPAVYKDIAGKLAERRVDRERYIDEFIAGLDRELRKADIDAEVNGRPKHIYSIRNKMRRKDIDFEHIFDVRAVRILTNSVQDCYGALGVVHTQWPHISGEFDDYIATPKENNYQSIHTAVIGPEGKIVEVQIRTHPMHEHNELGIASHWRYKEGGKQDANLDQKVAWLRQLLEWKEEVSDASEFVDRVKAEVFEERLYVFTPGGQVIDLPQGATPIDFAYAIHTEVGHRCRGAKVNGRIVPLTYALKNGEQVEVLTVKKGGPSRDWLSPHLGYTKTPRARSRIQYWFRQENYEQNVANGRQLLEKELHRMALNDVNFEKLARKMGYNKADDMFRMLAEGELKPVRAVNTAQEMVAPETVQEVEAIPIRSPRTEAPRKEFKVLGVGNLLTNLGSCCNPVPGDPIVGFITRGRGVTIHRQDCGNVLQHRTMSPERLVEVEWGTGGDESYPVDILVTAYDRHGLLRDITAVLADSKINVTAVSLATDKKEHLSHMTLAVEVTNIKKVSQVLSRIGQLPNVIEARRRLQ